MAIGHQEIQLGRSVQCLPEWNEREKASSLMDQMRALVVDLAGADISITKQQEGPGGALPSAIDVLGDDLDDLAAATDDLVARMESLGGFVDITDSRPLPGMEWTLVTDRDARQAGMVCRLLALVR